MSENRELRGRLQAELRKVAASVADGGAPDGVPSTRGAARGYPEDPGGTQTAMQPVLQRNVESAEKAYDTALQRYFSSQVDSRASQTNVAVLSPAVVPLAPYEEHDPTALARASAELREGRVGLVVMDCIGFRRKTRDMLQKELGVPVLVANLLVARVIAELCGL